MISDAEFQRRITQLLLDALDGRGFALAGAGAIRAHGLTDRPTADIDLFCGPRMSETDFSAAVDLGARALRDAGYEVAHVRGFSTFARLRAVDDGRMFEVDFAMSWRADPPVRLSVGPVLSERDAVAGKLGAVYSRGEIRDFLDLDAIRCSGRYTDETLLDLGVEHDAGFDRRIFAAQLSRVMDIRPSLTEQYDVTGEAFAAIQQRLFDWALRLRDEEKG
ncbi:nucleotidyl transferase AbiEii/AbiGii toxin family protein [Aeromicrobium sp. YIM 150415]|uniref:nucleotidyl transferase AbiEii/AbiGii toxin family protein n=1 Tax=Aeromicrobium sp. YIM 150415 TaxID=2803912 RepID=UPI001966133D|nr:nucleotidyl transferase AbiEii/AbiGii toxin family protein [Aeromicrobium sp. YIM 150415]MBM9463955.1 nucleotidyl transferase AbiEii/AbiGii toxin family protein [Aeromicrobium sp. YIM 150415]